MVAVLKGIKRTCQSWQQRLSYCLLIERGLLNLFWYKLNHTQK